ncbi:uncharacterized protein LOC128546091 [Mercenaria mercenaria]|uniref:uncharacterized protein LOC128546091 n=1 Tax=Mercenaria mercenaria TaxID=6596 RepID=UPI00234F67C4|nr:uncharacterized protein LOC128546091 [Mercenaria mercenaria]
MTGRVYKLFWIYFCILQWIIEQSNQAFGCTSTTVQHKQAGDNVTIQFQARTVNTENSALFVTNQILSQNDSTLLTVAYTNGVVIVPPRCNGCTFTGNAATGDLSIRLENVQEANGGTYKYSVIEASSRVKGCVTVYILGVPQTPKITDNNNNYEGQSIVLTCNSKSTTFPPDPNLGLN